MDFTKKLRLKQQIKNVPVEHLILQACATIENILENYINNDDVDFGKYNYLIEDSYNNIYKINSWLKSYCEQNVKKKFISGINEGIILSQLEKATHKDNIGFNLDNEVEKNDFIVYCGVKQLISYIKKQEVSSKELKNKIKMLNLYVSQFMNIFKKELAS